MFRDPNGPHGVKPGDTLEGTVRLLQRLLIQFDFVPPAGNCNNYPVTVVPEGINIDAYLESALQAYQQGGGKVVLAGRVPLRSASSLLRSSLGVLKMVDGSPGVPFLRYDPDIVADAELSDVAQYDGPLRLRPAASAMCPAMLVEAYFPRTWDRSCGHAQSPPDRTTDYVPVTSTDAGATIGFDLFGAFATHGQEHLVHLARTVFDRIYPRRLVLGSLPSQVEVSLVGRGEERVLHALSYAPQRRTPTLDLVEKATPLVDARVSVRIDREPKSLTLEPGGRAVTAEYRDGYVSICWSSTESHDLICIR